MAQNAACNRYHTVEQQLCRWLLLTLDRLPYRELVITHELVASKLCVRRESFTLSASQLQIAVYNRYRRGHISVLNRAGLERHACKCNGLVKKELGRLRNDVLTTPIQPRSVVLVKQASTSTGTCIEV
jgi:hypothetical protein